jgi:hypothetical protein
MYSDLDSGPAGPPGDHEQNNRPPGDVGAEAAAAGIGSPVWAIGGGVPEELNVAPAKAPLGEGNAPAVVPGPTHVSSLLSDIARAMQVVAAQERERIEASVAEETTAQIEKIHSRAAAEADELKRHADEEVSLVKTWREDQIQRIREDADRQIGDCRRRLEQSLTYHDSLIQTEIERVRVAVRGYRDSLSAYFGRLSREPDPSAIARQAGMLPKPPDLDSIRADARSSAMKELEQRSAAQTGHRTAGSLATDDGISGLHREPVGVMDPGAAEQGGDTFSRTTLPIDMSVPSAPSASQPSGIPTGSEVVTAASPPEALPSPGTSLPE